MREAHRFVCLAVAAGLLAGCSTLDKITGQTDNTVLPGSREAAIPGRPTFPEKQDVAVAPAAKPGTTKQTTAGTGAAETYCAPEDPSCKPPVSTGDTFKDPQ